MEINIKEQLDLIRADAEKELAAIASSEELEAFRVKVLGKKGELTKVLSQMGKLSAEMRPVIGQAANEVRAFIEEKIKTAKEQIDKLELEKKLSAEKLDVTLPGKAHRMGKKHPCSIVLDEVKDAFISMGFTIASGPEVEYDYYNFEALNIPK